MLTSVGTTRVSSPERLTALALLGIAFLLRIPYSSHYRFNSDEPQHLYVVWSWTRGLVPYRDFFDNHPPLFHVLMAPVMALVGERAEALPLMRLALLPLWLAALALTFVIARRLYSERVALWATALLAVHFEFFFTSLEFRTDLLWAVVWLAALATLVTGRFTPRRVFLVGALLGVAMSISQKTVLLAASLGCAALLALVLVPGGRARLPIRRAAALGAFWVAGILMLPALVFAGFAAAGALGPMLYCTVEHNLVSGLGTWGHPWRGFLLPVGVAVALWFSAPLIRAASGDRVRALRLVLLLTTVIYVFSVNGIWPLVTGQDWLPVHPLAAILVVGGVASWAMRRGEAFGTGGSAPPAVAWALAAVLAAELGVLVFKGPVWRDRGAPAVALVREAIRLTDPGDLVIDAKGETVFRRRAWYWVLESVTRERLRRGTIPDSLPEELAARGCCVATLDDPRFPARAREFLTANFIAVGRLRVAGKVIGSCADPAAPVRFRVAIPAEYTVVTEDGPAVGSLDGTPFTGPRTLGAGQHKFVATGRSGRQAVVWAKAVARGFSPFTSGGGAP